MNAIKEGGHFDSITGCFLTGQTTLSAGQGKKAGNQFCSKWTEYIKGLSAPDPDSIHIDLTPQSTSYETGSILDQSTSIVSALRTYLVMIRAQGPIVVM